MIPNYQQSFQDEARELLVELESALLELEERRDDRELIGRAFRALHTIKGTGGMCGFTNIAEFVHDIENAFEALRSGELGATAELINVSLAAGDQIRCMLDEAAGRGSADVSRSAKILAELNQLTAKSGDQRHTTPSQPAVDGETSGGRTRDWLIRFRTFPSIFLNGSDPLLLLRELYELGEVQIKIDTSVVPPLAELDPERCYLSWDIVLTTTAPSETIRDVFMFVESDCELKIERAADLDEKKVPVAKALEKKAGAAGRNAQSAGIASSIRVSADKLDQLVNLVGELVTVQARLSEFASNGQDAEVLEISESVDRLTAALRENSMSIRMLPLRSAFERFHRVVHDLSSELHKDVELSIEGADTELDKTVIDQLNDPLVHLIRNSMDHGIETPEARRAAGKSSKGSIHLSAKHSGATVLIQVSDDGAGVNIEAVRARAIKQCLIDSSARLSESEILNLVMAPGFSTAQQITGVSGRGVGMDVVRQNVEALRGSIEMANRPGVGLTVTLRLPLTLAIIDGLLVRVGQARFVVPLTNTLECVELTEQDIKSSHGKHLAYIRGEVVPYIRLSEYFEIETERQVTEQIVIVETEHGQHGFVVDEVLGNHQTVIKKLGRVYRNIQVASGATILGNGTVALILDPQRLVQHALQSESLKNRADGHMALPRDITGKSKVKTENTFILKEKQN